MRDVARAFAHLWGMMDPRSRRLLLCCWGCSLCGAIMPLVPPLGVAVLSFAVLFMMLFVLRVAFKVREELNEAMMKADPRESDS